MTTPTKEQIEKVAFELFNADFCAMTEADWDWRRGNDTHAITILCPSAIYFNLWRNSNYVRITSGGL